MISSQFNPQLQTLSLNFLDTENSQRNIIDLRNFKTLGSRGNEIILNITFVEPVPVWIFFLIPSPSVQVPPNPVCAWRQVPAPPARCGRSVRSDRNRTAKVSGMKQAHRKDWQKMCEEGGVE